ncbi:MAG: TetR/AcrR family transcriptional regulator [Deltaproteobacteria bacterium]|nr:TetR/AcrR family transcriptional regulator [Deltaproteobacteria bacterium]
MERTIGRREKERLARRREILAAAERLFATKGFSKTTMAEIAEESEFALATIYQFFKGKDEIYFTLIEEKSELLFSVIKEAIKGIPSSIEKIKRLIEIELNFFEEDRDFFKIFITERSGFEWSAREEREEKIRRMYDSYIQLIAKVIREGIRKGELKPLDPREMAYGIAGMINSFIFHWMRKTEVEPLSDKGDTLTEMVLGGLRG